MKLPRFNLRDLFWLVLVCALGIGWAAHTLRLNSRIVDLEQREARAKENISWRMGRLPTDLDSYFDEGKFSPKEEQAHREEQAAWQQYREKRQPNGGASMKLHLRDLFWLACVVGLATALCLERAKSARLESYLSELKHFTEDRGFVIDKVNGVWGISDERNIDQ